MKNLIFLLVVSVFLVFGCKQAKETKENMELGQELKKAGENIQKAVEEGNKRMEERRAKGDTLPIHFDKLKDFLPKEVKNFTPDGQPEGQTVGAQGMSFSMTQQRYTSGEDELTIIINDYNGVPSLFTMATAMIKANVTFENNDQFIKSLNLGIPDVGAMETYNKSQKEASLLLGIGDRFLVKIEAKNQKDTELVKSVAKLLPLSEMAAM
ncbi:hypothetical protein C7N43_37670 [Sphingobacteriales bacterium UPWRP_1]|nr:hypothetical protein BVG80_00125 [Sphingobacteriales bacterium TSM_CSM]PSJ71762.1 hypothetical protein C7N43_37670 [Sphingobacteriales bacterium UPWRP_1]